MIGEALPRRHISVILTRLDELLNSVSDMGFGVIDPDTLGGGNSGSESDSEQ